MSGGSIKAVELRGVTRRFGAVTALEAVSLDIEAGEFFSLLGPSGCGKTTLLRIVAGLDAADEGSLRIRGEDATGVPAYKRPVNTVFQSYALFPHLNVHDNVAFGLRMKKVPPPQIATRVAEVLKLVDLEALGHRRPSELSGGQRQRVALARAVVNEPQVLLLDEPLAALDVNLRRQLQTELRQVQRRLGLTFVYVTHDQEEAMALSDRIAVMNRGKVVQLGSPQELYERPGTTFVAQFLGACNLFSGRRKGADSYETALGHLRLECPLNGCDVLTVGIRPERVVLLPKEGGSQENTVVARVERAIYAGAETHYDLTAGGQSLRVESMNAGNAGPRFKAGEEVRALLPPDALMAFKDAGRE